MNITLAGKSALVTGAARGIGLSIATQLAHSGASVLLADVDEAELKKVESHLQELGLGVKTFAGDLTDPAIPQQLVETHLGHFGSLDIVVNNAGYTWDNVIQKTTDAQFQAMLEIHLVTPFRILRSASEYIRSAAKREKEQGKLVVRKVVNITSISGTDGNPGQAGYSSGKAGIIGLTKTLAKEWGRYNVTVNAVGFGLIDTRLIKSFDDPETKVQIGSKEVRVGMQATVRDAAMSHIPLGRLGTPEDAANAVFFFCSHLSDYITGEVLICGGGIHF